jgi:hypothetical protein
MSMISTISLFCGIEIVAIMVLAAIWLEVSWYDLSWTALSLGHFSQELTEHLLSGAGGAVTFDYIEVRDTRGLENQQIYFCEGATLFFARD